MDNILASITLDITWTLVATVGGTIFAVVSVMTGGAWKAWTVWQSLKQTQVAKIEQQTKDDEERQKLLTEQDSAIRESLLNRYKQMFELEKEARTRDLAQMNTRLERISKDCEEWDTKYRKLVTEYDQLKEKYDRVVQLNITYQQDKNKDTDEIGRLTKALNDLQKQVDILDPHKPEVH